MLLMIDNYDSFTYNLVQYFGELGEEVRVIRNDAATLDETAEKIKGLVPIGRFGTPDEIASTVLHLSAPESAFIVGAEIIASGGMGLL